MKTDNLIAFLDAAEKLKCNTRHSWTSSGRQESVAEHSWRLCVFAWLLRHEFPELKMERVIELCMFHDIGEALTGDFAAFHKGEQEEHREEEALKQLTELLDGPEKEELAELLREVVEKKTPEAVLFTALDKMEALLQHNEAPISSWLPLEYELQMEYGNEQSGAFPYTKMLRERLRQDSLRKISEEAPEGASNERKEEFYVSTDKKKLQAGRIKQLMEQTAWAGERTLGQCRKAMENSRCYGVYDRNDYQVGYARVLTDYTTTYYLADVIVDEACRGQGLGRLLLDHIIYDKELDGLYGMLHTQDKTGLYEKYGFRIYENDGTDYFMKRKKVRGDYE